MRRRAIPCRLVCDENKPSRRAKLEKLVSSTVGASDIQRTQPWQPEAAAEEARSLGRGRLQSPGGQQLCIHRAKGL